MMYPVDDITEFDCTLIPVGLAAGFSVGLYLDQSEIRSSCSLPTDGVPSGRR